MTAPMCPLEDLHVELGDRACLHLNEENYPSEEWERAYHVWYHACKATQDERIVYA